MSKLENVEFLPVDASGKNYLSWILDVEVFLTSKAIKKTITESNDVTEEQKASALMILRHLLDESLKSQYLTVRNPAELRLHDFKTVGEYNSDLFKITFVLKLCGENVTDANLIEKTLSTYHASNVVLQQQYRAKGYKTYGELISTLLLAKHNNELLLRNHETRPTGSTAFPEVNVISHNSDNFNNRGRGHHNGHEYGRGRGRSRGYDRCFEQGGSSHQKWKNSNNHKKWQNQSHKFDEKKDVQSGKSKCDRCGSTDHWTKTCHTPKYLVDLYQASLKRPTNAETNFVFDCGELLDITPLDMSNFFLASTDEMEDIINNE